MPKLQIKTYESRDYLSDEQSLEQCEAEQAVVQEGIAVARANPDMQGITVLKDGQQQVLTTHLEDVRIVNTDEEAAAPWPGSQPAAEQQPEAPVAEAEPVAEVPPAV